MNFLDKLGSLASPRITILSVVLSGTAALYVGVISGSVLKGVLTYIAVDVLYTVGVVLYSIFLKKD